MQICVARMLQESGIFFAVSCSPRLELRSLLNPRQLLSVLALGFAQGLYAVDAADGQVEDPSTVSLLILCARFIV